MRRFLTILLACVSVMCVSGCLKNRELGDWDPIKLSTGELIFGADGGQEDVYSLNRPPFVHHILDKTLGQIYYADFLNQERYNCSAPGISVSIKGDKITVRVEPSDEKRVWGISLWSGDASGAITVYQNKTSKD